MKDNHKVTKFFVNFYRISAMLDHNDSSFYRKAYNTMLKRVQDELVHFDKPQTLDELCNLIQKIDQHYWERRGDLTHETRLALATKAKTNESARVAPNNDQMSRSELGQLQLQF
jgi:hypothetical protein